MTIRHTLKSEVSLRRGTTVVIILALAGLCSCARPASSHADVNQACGALAMNVSNQEKAFVAQVQAIRSEHILLKDYDRRMIAVLDERRKAIQATLLTDQPAADGVSGCSGKALEEMRLNAMQEMNLLQGYINNFRRNVREDPDGVFIDSRSEDSTEGLR